MQKTYDTVAEFEAARQPLSSDPKARARFDAEITKALAFAKAGAVAGANGAMLAALRVLYAYSVEIADVSPMFVAWVRAELKAQPACLRGPGWLADAAPPTSSGPVHVSERPARQREIAEAFARGDFAAVMQIVSAGGVFLRPSDCPPAFLAWVESNVETHAGLRCDVTGRAHGAPFRFKTAITNNAPAWARI